MQICNMFVHKRCYSVLRYMKTEVELSMERSWRNSLLNYFARNIYFWYFALYCHIKQIFNLYLWPICTEQVVASQNIQLQENEQNLNQPIF